MESVFYLAGPMTGYPKFNIPRFNYVADRLYLDYGLVIIAPPELDDEDVKAASLASEDGKMTDGMIAGQTWGDLLSRDIKIVADEVDGVIAIDQWWQSKGARLEVFTALSCRKSVYHYYSDTRMPVKLGMDHCLQMMSSSLLDEEYGRIAA